MKNRKSSNKMLNRNGKYSQQDFSLYHLGEIGAKLSTQEAELKKQKQKIKQEALISNKVKKQVAEEIASVESAGTFYAAKLEEQKRKNEALQILVGHYQTLIYDKKKENCEEMIKSRTFNKSMQFNSTVRRSIALEDSQPTETFTFELEEQTRKLNQLEKAYEVLILKNNSSNYELSQKQDEVRTLRSERTILNKVFDQFEREIFDYEFLFKKLVIESSVLETQFKERVSVFQTLRAKTKKQVENIQEQGLNRTLGSYLCDLQLSRSSINHSMQILSTNRYTVATKNTKQLQLKSFGEDEGHASDKNKEIQDQKSKRAGLNLSRFGSKDPRTARSERPKTKRMASTKYEDAVKDILQDLNVNSINQLCGIVNRIDLENTRLFMQSESLFQQIYLRQKKYSPVAEASQGSQYCTKLEEQRRNLLRVQQAIAEQESQLQMSSQQVQQFEQQELELLDNVVECFGSQQLNQPLTASERLLLKMQKLEKALEPILLRGTTAQSSSKPRNDEAGLPKVRLSQLSRAVPNSCGKDSEVGGNRQKKCGGNGNGGTGEGNSYEPNCLEKILKANKNVQNNTTIYSEDELIEISKQNLSHAGRASQSWASRSSKLSACREGMAWAANQ